MNQVQDLTPMWCRNVNMTGGWIFSSNLGFLPGGHCRGCASFPIMFVVFMDMISRSSHGEERLQAGDPKTPPHCFLLMIRSYERKGEGMRISASKSEAMVLSRKHMDLLLQVGDTSLPQVKEFKYLGVFFTRK